MRRRPGGRGARCGARGGERGLRWPRRWPGRLSARGSEGRDLLLPGLRETAPETRTRVYLAAGLRPPRGGRESGGPESGGGGQACGPLLPGGEVRLSG